MTLETTLALAVKQYRAIVDSRRFIPIASKDVFKTTFDEILVGLLDSLGEVFTLDSDSSTITVDAKEISLATDVMKILIILKHFIGEPVYADEVIHGLYAKAAHLKDFKIVSKATEFDDHKAKKRFETFLVNLYVLLDQDNTINENVSSFFRDLSASRLQTVLLEAAPRASQEEMYRQGYRDMLLKQSTDNEALDAIIKRLDSYYPVPKLVDGMTRKDFILDRLEWKNTSVYKIVNELSKQLSENVKEGNIDASIQKFEYLWILLSECKFVAVDESCATLFIFPSECESFLKASNTFSACFSELTTLTISAEQGEHINAIHAEIYDWVVKLIRSLSSNYIHFERDLNNHNSRSSNRLLYKIIVTFSYLSKGIHSVLSSRFPDLILKEPVESNKLFKEFIDKPDKVEAVIGDVPLVENPEKQLSREASNLENDDEITTKKQEPLSIHTAIQINNTQGHLDKSERKSGVNIWAIIIGIFCTIAAALSLKFLVNNSNKS